mgnify:CR=1 FL=1
MDHPLDISDPALVAQVLSGRDHLARLRAMECVDASAAPEVVRLLLDDGRPNAQACACRLIGKHRLVPHLDVVARLVRPGRAVRVLKAAVVCLGALGAAEHAKVLLPLLDHDNAMLRRAVVETLGRIGAGHPPLIRALADPSWEVRMYAAIGLGACTGQLEAHEALVVAVDTEAHAATAEQMVRAVAEVACDGAAVALCGWLDSAGQLSGVRRAAARGLGELRQGEPSLLAALGEVDSAVVEEASWALDQIRRAAQ